MRGKSENILSKSLLQRVIINDRQTNKVQRHHFSSGGPAAAVVHNTIGHWKMSARKHWVLFIVLSQFLFKARKQHK